MREDQSVAEDNNKSFLAKHNTINLAVGEYSTRPKFTPKVVTENEPDVWEFVRETVLSIWPSYEKISVIGPSCIETLITTSNNVRTPAATKPVTEVSAVHIVDRPAVQPTRWDTL